MTRARGALPRVALRSSERRQNENGARWGANLTTSALTPARPMGASCRRCDQYAGGIPPSSAGGAGQVGEFDVKQSPVIESQQLDVLGAGAGQLAWQSVSVVHCGAHDPPLEVLDVLAPLALEPEEDDAEWVELVAAAFPPAPDVVPEASPTTAESVVPLAQATTSVPVVRVRAQAAKVVWFTMLVGTYPIAARLTTLRRFQALR